LQSAYVGFLRHGCIFSPSDDQHGPDGSAPSGFINLVFHQYPSPLNPVLITDITQVAKHFNRFIRKHILVSMQERFRLLNVLV
jgi:hypothetical protein